MSVLPILLFSLAVIPFIPNQPDISADLDYKYVGVIDYISFEPLKRTGDLSRVKIKASFKEKPSTPATLRILVISDSVTEDTEIASFSFAKKYQTIEYSYHQAYTSVFNEQNSFLFQLTSDYGFDQVNIDMPYYSFKNCYVNQENQIWSSNSNICLYKPATGVKFVKETLKVQECVTDIYLNPGEPLNLNHFTFSYNSGCGNPLFCENPRMYIDTNGTHFSNFGTSVINNTKVQLPLKITKTPTTTYLFEKANDYYVNPLTCEMSTKPLNGYTQTDNLYFPLTTKEEETYLVILAANNIGANLMSFHYEFTVHTGRKIFGNCRDYEYCLNSRDAEADMSVGKSIGH